MEHNCWMPFAPLSSVSTVVVLFIKFSLCRPHTRTHWRTSHIPCSVFSLCVSWMLPSVHLAKCLFVFFSSSLISIFFHRKKIAAKIVLVAPENPFKQCSSLQIYMQSKHYSITAHTQSIICATNLSWKGGMETRYFQWYFFYLIDLNILATNPFLCPTNGEEELKILTKMNHFHHQYL